MRALLTSLTVSALATAMLAAAPIAAAPAATCGSAPDAQLFGVAATSATDVWAVGNYRGSAHLAQTLIEHWDGTSWCVVPSPDPGGPGESNGLDGVTATSATDAWAVGDYFAGPGAGRKTLILHWNGTAWLQTPSPNPSHTVLNNILAGVSAASATSAWAFGAYSTMKGVKLLLLYWNGTVWRQVKNSGLGSHDGVSAIDAVSPSSAWAVGGHGDPAVTLTERWNGTTWQHVPSPNPVTGLRHANGLDAVTAASPSSTWAVGAGENLSSGDTIFALRWDGTAWKATTTPQPGLYNNLTGVTATSASSAWAVGFSQPSTSLSERSVILRWDGTSWSRVSSPDPGTDNFLYAVAATSASNAWAVGQTSTGSTGGTFIVQWNGTVWKRVISP